jgi:hypothetical protein
MVTLLVSARWMNPAASFLLSAPLSSQSLSQHRHVGPPSWMRNEFASSPMASQAQQGQRSCRSFSSRIYNERQQRSSPRDANGGSTSIGGRGGRRGYAGTASSSSSSSTRMGAHHSSYYLATCVPGLAHVLKLELEDLRRRLDDNAGGDGGLFGIETSGNAAVTFRATREASLHALCWLRSAHRLLELVASTEGGGDAHGSDDADANAGGGVVLLRDRRDVHDFVRRHVNVRELLGDGCGGLLTVSVKVVMNRPHDLPQDLSHSHYTALTIKNALCDVVREMRGDRPDVDVEDPDVPLVAFEQERRWSSSSSSSVVVAVPELTSPG